MKEPKGAEEPTIKEKIVVILKRKEGEHVTTGEISGALGIRRDQATSALHNLAKRSMVDSVRRVGDGVWTYQSPSPLTVGNVDATFSAVGTLGDGQVLLIDETGQLWQAYKVEAPA